MDTKTELAISLIRRASQLLEFDKENCDFGPALGIHEQEKASWQRAAASYLNSVTIKNQGR